jgi:hypothetical protein
MHFLHVVLQTPVIASAQRPLFDVEKVRVLCNEKPKKKKNFRYFCGENMNTRTQTIRQEANRALHYIETIAPLDLMSQVCCRSIDNHVIGIESAMQLCVAGQITATILRGITTLLGWDCTASTR